MRKRTKEFYEKMNEVMEKLAKTYLSENDSKYSWVLLRRTFGYGEYKVKISRFKMADLTGILEVNVSRTQKRLKERNIIQVNGKLKGFNLNTDEWKKVSLQIPFQKVSLPILKGIATDTKRGIATDTLITNQRKNTPRREDFYKKISGTEIEKLELDQWYRAIMYNVGEFSIFYIEGTIDDYPYNTRMSCWYIYEKAVNVRNKEAYFSNLLRKYQEDLEN